MAFALLFILGMGPRLAHAQKRWDRLSPWAKQVLTLRREVRAMHQQGRLPIAHPDVARRLSEQLSQHLGRNVKIAPARIIQVTWSSAEHRALKALLGESTIGVGIYPSKRWGHNKLRIGAFVTDAVPRGASPFPREGSRARLVPHEGMSQRFYDPVFVGAPEHVAALQQRAEALVADKRESGMGCGSFVSKLVREHLRELEAQGVQPYGGKLEGFKRSKNVAGDIWKSAAGAQPALIVVYLPQGDHRSITHPDFKFDYAF